jgi:hypothetical protein
MDDTVDMDADGDGIPDAAQAFDATWWPPPV